MRVLAIEREMPARAQPPSPELLHEEAAGVWAFQKQGIIREVWFTADRHAVVMLECASVAEARQYLAALPLARYGRIDFTLLELHSYDGFERLFAATNAAPRPKPEEPPEY